MNKTLIDAIRKTVKLYPHTLPYLDRRTRYVVALGGEHGEYKTLDAYQRQIWNRVIELYRGEIDDGEFVDAMANVIEQQLTKAFREALRDNEMDAGLVQEEPYAPALEDMILNEFDFVDGLAADVLAAKEAGAGFEQFQARVDIWANRYNDAYNQCQLLISVEEGENLEWVYGETEHCDICRELNGIVAKATTWRDLGVYPQEPPNAALAPTDDKKGCSGWHCQCELVPTERRQTPKAYDLILNAVNK